MRGCARATRATGRLELLEDAVRVRIRGRRHQVQVSVEHAAHVVDRRQVGEERHEVGQLGVVAVRARGKESVRLERRKDGEDEDARVVEPAADRDGVVRVEDVACRRVVDDDALGYRAAELRQVLRGEERRRQRRARGGPSGDGRSRSGSAP